MEKRIHRGGRVSERETREAEESQVNSWRSIFKALLEDCEAHTGDKKPGDSSA